MSSKPVDAYLLIEKLPATYKGTPVARSATDLMGKLKKDKAVAMELSARPALEAIRKIEKQLDARSEGVNPQKMEEFRKANAPLLKQLKNRLAAMKKSWPEAKATQDATAIADKFDNNQRGAAPTK